MFKKDEIADPNSCLGKAYPDEMVFVLLARDLAAPEAIRAWVGERLALGLNRAGDKQIENAIKTIQKMKRQQPILEKMKVLLDEIRDTEENLNSPNSVEQRVTETIKYCEQRINELYKTSLEQKGSQLDGGMALAYAKILRLLKGMEKVE